MHGLLFGNGAATLAFSEAISGACLPPMASARFGQWFAADLSEWNRGALLLWDPCREEDIHFGNLLLLTRSDIYSHFGFELYRAPAPLIIGYGFSYRGTVGRRPAFADEACRRPSPIQMVNLGSGAGRVFAAGQDATIASSVLPAGASCQIRVAMPTARHRGEGMAMDALHLVHGRRSLVTLCPAGKQRDSRRSDALMVH